MSVVISIALFILAVTLDMVFKKSGPILFFVIGALYGVATFVAFLP